MLIHIWQLKGEYLFERGDYTYQALNRSCLMQRHWNVTRNLQVNEQQTCKKRTRKGQYSLIPNHYIFTINYNFELPFF